MSHVIVRFVPCFTGSNKLGIRLDNKPQCFRKVACKQRCYAESQVIIKFMSYDYKAEKYPVDIWRNYLCEREISSQLNAVM